MSSLCELNFPSSSEPLIWLNKKNHDVKRMCNFKSTEARMFVLCNQFVMSIYDLWNSDNIKK